uniref:Str_synth domain-containing protein n=1 Tax=Heterorhabditis bacteriophora TaxID=37862 RepID=A0A1I7XUV7_HETBA
MFQSVAKLFIIGLIGVFLSWIGLYYRYNDETTRFAKEYELPAPPPLVGPLEINEKLQNVEYILKDQIVGPESLVIEGDSIYTTLYDGRIVHIRDGEIVGEVRFTKEKNCGSFESEHRCGRPLGIRRLNKQEMVVADAYLGIFAVDMKTGGFRHLVKSSIPVEGRHMRFLNDIEVLNEDEIIFTDSSYKYDRRHFMHIFLEQVPNGRILLHTVSTGKTRVLIDNLYFPNGIQLHPDGQSIVFSECSMARIRKYSFYNNQLTTFAENLPGIPDNIRLSDDGTLWVGLAGVRYSGAPSMIDIMGPYALARQILIDVIPSHWWITYLPYIKPHHAMVIQLDAEGKILSSLHDTTGKYISDISEVTASIFYLCIIIVNIFVSLKNAPSTLHATLIDTPEPKEVHSSMVAKNDIVTTESYVTQKMDELQVLKLTQPLPSVPLEVSPSQSQYDKLNK